MDLSYCEFVCLFIDNTRINEINVYACFKRFVSQFVGYELIESFYESSECGYKSSGYETSMGTKNWYSFKTKSAKIFSF